MSTPTIVLGFTTVYVETAWQRDRVADIVAIDAAVTGWAVYGRDMVQRELRACASVVNTLNTDSDVAASSRIYVARTLAAIRAFVEEHNADVARTAPVPVAVADPVVAPLAGLSPRARELACTAIRVHMAQLDSADRYGIGRALFPLDQRDTDMQAMADALAVLDPNPDGPELPPLRHHTVTLPGASHA